MIRLLDTIFFCAIQSSRHMWCSNTESMLEQYKLRTTKATEYVVAVVEGSEPQVSRRLHFSRQEIITVVVSCFRHVEGVIFSFFFLFVHPSWVPLTKKITMILPGNFITLLSIFVTTLQLAVKVITMYLFAIKVGVKH